MFLTQIRASIYTFYGVGFSIWRHSFKTAAMTPFRAENCCHLCVEQSSRWTATARHLPHSPRLGGYLRHFCSLRLGALWFHCFNGAGYKHSYLLTWWVNTKSLASASSKQEAQLPQRNSASAAHMEGTKPSSPLSLPPLATPMRTVESETRNKRTPSVPSVKRTLSWIGHSRSFKVILICADRNPEPCIVLMSN